MSSYLSYNRSLSPSLGDKLLVIIIGVFIHKRVTLGLRLRFSIHKGFQHSISHSNKISQCVKMEKQTLIQDGFVEKCLSFK